MLKKVNPKHDDVSLASCFSIKMQNPSYEKEVGN
jgi:hypothetical protein